MRTDSTCTASGIVVSKTSYNYFEVRVGSAGSALLIVLLERFPPRGIGVVSFPNRKFLRLIELYLCHVFL